MNGTLLWLGPAPALLSKLLIALLFLAAPPVSQAADPKPAMQAILKLVTVVASAKAAEGGAAELKSYFASTAGPGESIYSVRFNFDRSSWADWLSRPDIFLVVEHEGGRQILIPDIEYGWDYGPKIYTFRCPTLAPGSHCVLRLYDDDSASDQVWKQVLTTKTRWNASGTGRVQASARIPEPIPVEGLAAIEANVNASGQIQLLSDEAGQSLALDAPDPIAVAEFAVPEHGSSDQWAMEGQFVSDGTDYGSVHLTHWYTNSLPSVMSYLMQPRLVFWAAILIGALTVLAIRQTKSSTKASGSTGGKIHDDQR